jgi:hypothetical protein
MIACLGRCLDNWLLGSLCELRRANRIVAGKIKKCHQDDFLEDKRLCHSEQRLVSACETSIELVKRIESKAMGTLVGVAVAVSVLGASSGIVGPKGMLADYPAVCRIAVGAILAIAMAYFFGSGFLALQAYRIGEVYRPTLEDEAPLVTPGEMAQVLLYCIEQNHRVATLRSNRLSASFNLLRNGVATILLLGIVIIVLSAACQAGPAAGKVAVPGTQEHGKPGVWTCTPSEDQLYPLTTTCSVVCSDQVWASERTRPIRVYTDWQWSASPAFHRCRIPVLPSLELMPDLPVTGPESSGAGR